MLGMRSPLFVTAVIACAPAPAPAPAPAMPPMVGYAPPPAPIAAPCAEGGYGCTPDRAALTVCRQGRTFLASTCRGPRACSVAAAVDCDHSIAQAGDPCEASTEIACGIDRKTLLRCAGGTYQPSESCRNACLSTQGRVLCQ